MKLDFQHTFIYLFVTLFFISMGSEITINLQYGNTSMYNEIEHVDSQSDTSESVKLKVKVCQELPNFELVQYNYKVGLYDKSNDDLNHQFVLSYPSPPPKLI